MESILKNGKILILASILLTYGVLPIGPWGCGGENSPPDGGTPDCSFQTPCTTDGDCAQGNQCSLTGICIPLLECDVLEECIAGCFEVCNLNDASPCAANISICLANNTCR